MSWAWKEGGRPQGGGAHTARRAHSGARQCGRSRQLGEWPGLERRDPLQARACCATPGPGGGEPSLSSVSPPSPGVLGRWQGSGRHLWFRERSQPCGFCHRVRPHTQPPLVVVPSSPCDVLLRGRTPTPFKNWVGVLACLIAKMRNPSLLFF